MSQAVATTETDRYVSFCGIECNQWADQLIGQVKQHLAQAGADAQWQAYFSKKFEQQDRMGHDNLFFVGSQVNTLYSFLEEVDDDAGKELLWKLEQECC